MKGTRKTQEMSTAVLRIKTFLEEILLHLPLRMTSQDRTSMTYPAMKKETSGNLFAPTLIRKMMFLMTPKERLYLNKYNTEEPVETPTSSLNQTIS